MEARFKITKLGIAGAVAFVILVLAITILAITAGAGLFLINFNDGIFSADRKKIDSGVTQVTRCVADTNEHTTF